MIWTVSGNTKLHKFSHQRQTNLHNYKGRRHQAGNKASQQHLNLNIPMIPSLLTTKVRVDILSVGYPHSPDFSPNSKTIPPEFPLRVLATTFSPPSTPKSLRTRSSIPGLPLLEGGMNLHIILFDPTESLGV